MTPKEEAYQKVQAYLFTNRKRLEVQNVDYIVWELRTYVSGNDAIPDSEMRATVMIWRSLHGPRYPLTTVPPPTMPESKVIETIKGALTTVIEGIDIKYGAGKVNIAVTGVTAELAKGTNKASVGVSWGGALAVEAKKGDFHFSGQLSSDKWQISLSYPMDTVVPEYSKLGKVFSEGEKSMRGLVSTLSGFPNLLDSKVRDVVSAQMKPVGEAVEAVKGIAKAPKSGVSVGVTFGSPDPNPGPDNAVPPPPTGIPRGIQGVITLTVTF